MTKPVPTEVQASDSRVYRGSLAQQTVCIVLAAGIPFAGGLAAVTIAGDNLNVFRVLVICVYLVLSGMVLGYWLGAERFRYSIVIDRDGIEKRYPSGCAVRYAWTDLVAVEPGQRYSCMLQFSSGKFDLSFQGTWDRELNLQMLRDAREFSGKTELFAKYASFL